jgi:hypothetical protein
MDVSDLRKRIMRALDDARKDATTKRTAVDAARADFATFLSATAVPLVRQAAQVLRAEGHQFSVETPADSVRLVNDHASDTYLEVALEVGDRPRVVGRVSVTRGRRGVLLEERELAPSTPVAGVEEDDVAKFLVSEVAKLVLKQ